MMEELYSFEQYKGYTVVVEPLSEGEFEGIAFIHSHQNPPFYITKATGEAARLAVIEWVDANGK